MSDAVPLHRDGSGVPRRSEMSPHTSAVGAGRLSVSVWAGSATLRPGRTAGRVHCAIKLPGGRRSCRAALDAVVYRHGRRRRAGVASSQEAGRRRQRVIAQSRLATVRHQVRGQPDHGAALRSLSVLWVPCLARQRRERHVVRSRMLLPAEDGRAKHGTPPRGDSALRRATQGTIGVTS